MKKQKRNASPVGVRVTSTETGDHGNLIGADQFVYQELKKRPVLSVEELLPTQEDWQNWWKERNKKRLRKLKILWLMLALLLCCHLGIVIMTLIYRLYIQTWILRHTLPQLHTDVSEGSIFFDTNCAAIYPEYTGTDDWYIIDGLPYATLPRKRAYFASSKYINTFLECYLAYWLNVPPSKRQFINGQLRFFGKRANSSCLQIGRKGINEIANVANCLTLSFFFQLRNSVNFSGIPNLHAPDPPKPVVAYIGGLGLLNHQPKLIPIDLLTRLDIFYVIIRYRLGIFGFGDFDTAEYGPNHGVEDVRKALQWIHENTLRFGGSPAKLILIGENSGAAIAMQVGNYKLESLMKTNVTNEHLVSKLWIHEGTLTVPDVPSEERPFHSLVLSDIELISKCQNWLTNNQNENLGSTTLSIRAACLENSVNETMWLNKTPAEWINADKRMHTLPSKKEDIRDSLLLDDANVSQVTSPFKFTSIRYLPIVWISSLKNPNPPPPTSMTLRGLSSKVKTAFADIVSVNIKRNFAEELVKSYDPMVTELKQSPSKNRFSPLLNAMIADIRANCLVYAYLKRRVRFQRSKRGPVYRIISEMEPPGLIEKTTGRNYDIPAFLCGRRGKGYPTETFLEAFSDFIKTGSISSMKELEIPQKVDDPDIDSTVNVLGPIGLTTPTSRVTSHFAACNNWIADHEESDLALKYGRVN